MKRGPCIDCSESRLRSALKIAGGSLSGGGSLGGPSLYHSSLKCGDHEYNSLHQTTLLARGAPRKNGRSSVLGFGSFRTARAPRRFSQVPRPSTMDAKSSKRQKHRESALSLLNVAIEATNLAKEISSATPAKAVFGSVSILLTMIAVRFLPSDGTFQAHV